jgi:hypothetical protein
MVQTKEKSECCRSPINELISGEKYCSNCGIGLTEDLADRVVNILTAEPIETIVKVRKTVRNEDTGRVYEQTSCHICGRDSDKYGEDICFKCGNMCCTFDRTILYTDKHPGKTVCTKCVSDWLEEKK